MRKNKLGRAKKPFWVKKNLIDHYNKHPNGVDKTCWKALLNVGDVDLDTYRDRSIEVTKNCWLCYEGRLLDVKPHTQIEHRSLRTYHYDKKLLLTVTDAKTEAIITCFHFHEHKSKCSAILRRTRPSVGKLDAELYEEERHRLVRKLMNEKRAGKLKNIKSYHPNITPSKALQQEILLLD